MRIAFTVQYDGKYFKGYQTQSDSSIPTVQDALRKAFSTVLRRDIHIYVAGRTDTGVHATGQVIHINMDSLIHIDKTIHSVNAILPKSISVIYGKFVSDEFHALYSCVSRSYIYCILNTPYCNKFYINHLWIRHSIDWDRVESVIPCLLGRHNFAAFTKTRYNHDERLTTKYMYEIKLIRCQSRIYFYFRASGFLHNMIRILVGTLLDIAMGKISLYALPDLIHKQDRTMVGHTAPPYPLFFINAGYKEYSTPTHLLAFQDIIPTE